MQIFVNYKNSSYIFCWFAHDVTEARLVIKNKSVLLWDLNSISSELFKLIVYCIDHQQDRLVSLLQTKNSSLWFVHPCFAFSEKSPELQQSYLWIQSFIWRGEWHIAGIMEEKTKPFLTREPSGAAQFLKVEKLKLWPPK